MDPKWIGAILVALVQGVLFFRWLIRRMLDDAVNRKFVRDVATNHLPHIYSALRQMAHKQGIELEEPPQIQWIDLENGKGRK